MGLNAEGLPDLNLLIYQNVDILCVQVRTFFFWVPKILILLATRGLLWEVRTFLAGRHNFEGLFEGWD